MSSSRLRLVAATTRTSTGIASVPPTGIASRSCSTRSSLTCVAGDISPISSRKNRSEEHTSELQSRPHLVCRLLLEKKKNKTKLYFRLQFVELHLLTKTK